MGAAPYGLARRSAAAPSRLLSAASRSSPPMTLEAAAEAFREAMRQTVKRYSLWYFVEGILLVAAGVLAIIYPVISSASVVFLLGWLLIVSGILQGLSMVEGISKVVFALTIRPMPGWGWVLSSGLLGIILSLFLWVGLPVTAVWLIGLLLGIELISVGAAIALLAWKVRHS